MAAKLEEEESLEEMDRFWSESLSGRSLSSTCLAIGALIKVLNHNSD